MNMTAHHQIRKESKHMGNYLSILTSKGHNGKAKQHHSMLSEYGNSETKPV